MAFPAQKSIHLVRILTQVGRRQVSSASAAISQSLQYFGGKRVASLNQNAADDFDVFEPATGTVHASTSISAIVNLNCCLDKPCLMEQTREIRMYALLLLQAKCCVS